MTKIHKYKYLITAYLVSFFAADKPDLPAPTTTIFLSFRILLFFAFSFEENKLDAVAYNANFRRSLREKKELNIM